MAAATEMFSAFDATTIDEVFVLGSVEGDLDSLGADGIAVSSDEAIAKGWTIGSTVPVTFPSGDTTFVVEAIYSSGTDWVGPAVRRPRRPPGERRRRARLPGLRVR